MRRHRSGSPFYSVASYGTGWTFPTANPNLPSSNQPGFVFDFFVATGDITPTTNLFFDLVFGDHGAGQQDSCAVAPVCGATLRFVGQMTVDEAAEELGISVSTAQRDWAYARAWLFRQLTSEEDACG